MTLRQDQESLQVGILYEIKQSTQSEMAKTEANRIWIKDGSVNLYTSDSATQPTSISQMTLDNEDAGFTGRKSIESGANYIAITQVLDTTTEITLTGYEIIEDHGTIA